MTIRKRSVPVVFVTLASFLGTHVLPLVALAASPAEETPLVRESAPSGDVFEQTLQSEAADVKAPAFGANLSSALGESDSKLPDSLRGKSDLSSNPGPAKSDPSSIAAVVSAIEPQKTAELLTGGDKNGASSKAISTPQGAGKIDGMGESFSAQLSTGTANYSVPIMLPTARGGAQPALSLSYSSGSGSGLAGMGWDIGIPAVSRQTDRGLPKYDDRSSWHPEQDRFVFNGGQELVPICTVGAAPSVVCSGALSDEVMPVWSAGWQYFRPRVEGGYLRFFWSPNHLTWRVQDKTGVTKELGVPLDGSNDLTGLETNPNAPAQIFTWQLVREYDAFGNTNPASGNPTPRNLVLYKYLQFGGRAYLSDIYDTTPAGNPTSYALGAFAHHTRLRYDQRPDPTVSYRSGWARKQALRLAHIDVTSKTYSDGTSSQRSQLRRYHLGYDAAFHTSFLSSVQLEGRCSGDERNAPKEDGNFSLVATSSCARLPPLSMSYSHATGAVPVAGYEPLSTKIVSATTSAGAVAKSFGVSDTSVEFFDVNSDGLPDVIWSPPWKAFLNGAQGSAAAFAPGIGMSVNSTGVDPAAALLMNAIQLNNPNLVPLDFDGDGAIDMVHTPALNDVRVYSLAKNSAQLSWVGRKVTGTQNFKVDLRTGTRRTQVADVNFDGLVDVVVATGEQLQTFFALGRYVGGQGRFGTATRTGALTSNFSADPVSACLPWAGQSVDFDSGTIQLAEMNGDGIIDIVKLEAGNVRYWPGRGDGHWGDRSRELPSGCRTGIEDTGYVSMGSSPFYSGFRPERIRLEDVNGDGLQDISQVDENSVSVWLNVDGTSWTPRVRLENMPSAALDLGRVRFADVNGSGTPDIFWGNGSSYQFVDLTGGVRTGVLTGVDNGLGKTTTLEYATSTSEMLGAEQAPAACDPNKPWGTRWCSKMPTVVHVLKRMTESDNLNVAGKTTTQVTEYAYRDPVFDGRQREFRGFRLARVKVLGDTYAPTDYTESRFLLGECEDETVGAFDNQIDDCADPGRDNPREALKGLPIITHKYSETGIYLTTEASTYRLRNLYSGLDGRAVRSAFEVGKRAILYDAAAGATSSMRTENQTVVELERGYDAAKDPLKVTSFLTNPATIPAGEVSSSLQFQVPAYANYAVVEQATYEDFFGNKYLSVDKGCTSGNACPVAGPGMAVDEQLYNYVLPSLPTGQLTNWIWRPATSYSRGSAHASVDRNKSTFTYTPEGSLKTTSATVIGSGVLDRFHATAKPTAPTPTDAYTDGTFVASDNQYDAFGNLIKETLPLNRCRKIAYDTLLDASSVSLGYAQHPISETLYPQGCEVGAGLTTAATYDRGLSRVTSVIDLTGQRTAIAYDEFGRLSALRRPHADGTVTLDTDLPFATYEYVMPANSSIKYSIVHTSTQDGATEGASSYLDSYAYVDGLGRARATLAEADPSQGDGGNWIVSRLVTMSAKGTPVFTYQPFFSNASATAFPLATVPSSPYAEQDVDAFGRVYRTYDLDRTQTLEKRYHALSTDNYDAEDLSAGSHNGTYATSRLDGHGRVIATTERVKVAGVIETRDMRTTYLPTGELETMTRTLPDKATPPTVMRWMRYDSAGRLILNVDANTTVNFTTQVNASGTPSASGIKAWRYVYNNAGETVGTSDARGCGQNFFYDGVGRLIAEDFSPCESHHADWVQPNLTPGTGYGTGLEALYIYDSAGSRPAGTTPAGYNLTSSYLPGHLAAVYDRGQNSFLTYDARGRLTRVDKRVTVPGARTSDFSLNYAQDWYSRSFTFDAADREIKAGTGAQRAAAPASPIAAADGTSDVTTVYSKRGVVASVGSSYGPLIASSKRDADDLFTQVQYADVAKTTTNYAYDPRRRVSTVETDRAAPGLWSTPTNYTPAPTLTGTPTTFQLVLQNQQYSYDLVGNPTKIQDNRTAAEWPAGALPVSQTIQYDDAYRVSQVDYGYPSTDDTWVSPHAADVGGAADTRRATPSPHVTFAKRVKSQTYQYDWLGNISQSGDDASGFYDRSLGTQVHDSVASYQLKSATGVSTSARNGRVDLGYTPGGYTKLLQVTRSGPCLPTSARCNQRFDYQWDEIGRLQSATRNDVVNQTDALGSAEATLSYQYDSDDNRVLKTSADSLGRERNSVYPFATFELRGATFDTTAKKYTRDATTEVAYLVAHGVHIGRVAYHAASDNVPRLNNALVHVFIEVGDTLGSTSIVLDKDTSELVERQTYFAYGATESDYRPDRWKGFREDNGFSGKEADIEIGLVYFGKRFYSPYLNRWASPDPMALHVPGRADQNLYAYVHGQLYVVIDPVGLEGARFWGGAVVNAVKVAVHAVRTDPVGSAKAVAKASGTMSLMVLCPPTQLYFAYKAVKGAKDMQPYLDKCMAGKCGAADVKKLEAVRNEMAVDTTVAVLGSVAAGGAIKSGVGGGRIGGSTDCAAHTAARIIESETGMDITAAEVQAQHGLPQKSNGGYLDILSKGITYFTENVGIKFAETKGGLTPGGKEGSYAVFFSGGETGGHVMYGRVKNGVVTIEDAQAGKTYSSVAEAERGYGGKAETARRVESVPASKGGSAPK